MVFSTILNNSVAAILLIQSHTW